MAEALPTGTQAPDALPGQQETRAERRRRRRELARTAVRAEGSADPRIRAQAQALQETPALGFGHRLDQWNERVDQLEWKAIKAMGRAVVWPVKKTFKGAGMGILAGGLAGVWAGGLLYLTGKSAWQYGSTTYKSRKFFDSMTNNFNLTWSKMGVSKKK